MTSSLARDLGFATQQRIVLRRDRVKLNRIESSDCFTYILPSLNPFYFSLSPRSIFFSFSLYLCLSFRLLRLFALDRAVLWTVTEPMSVIPKMFPTSIHANF